MKPVERPINRLIIALLLALMVVSSARAGVTSAEGLELTVDTNWPGTGKGGYFPVRISVRNVRQQRDLRIELQARGLDTIAANLGRNFTVEQNQTVSFTIPVPMVNNYSYYQVKIYEDGREIGRGNLTQRVNLDFWREGVPLLIISEHKEDLRSLSDALRDIHPGRGGVDPEDLLCQVLPAEMPEGWICYTQLGVIGVSARAVEMMPRARREELRKWIATGGTLFIYRPITPQSDSLSLILGEGSADTNSENQIQHYLGSIRLVQSDPFGWDKDAWKSFLKKDIRHQQSGFRARFGFEQTGQSRSSRRRRKPFLLDIPGVGRVPIRIYAVMITLFAVGIGPLNYFLLKRKKKLHLLFVITPLAAVAVTVGMITYGMFSEGLGIKGRCLSLTCLDQDRHEAVTVGRMSLYAGMSPRGGMLFPMDVAVFPAAGEMRSGSLELGGSQRFEGGYLPSRTLVNFVTAGVAPARGRLVVKRTQDSLQISNGLGVGIKLIYLMDESGNTFRAEKIAAGGEATAKACPALTGRRAGGLGISQDSKIPLLTQAQLEKSTYLAELEDSPFFVTGLDEVAESGSRHILYGRFAEASNDSPTR